MRSIEEIKNGKWKENKDVPVMDTGSAWNASVKLFEQYKAAAKVQREETKRLMSMPTYWGTTGAEHRKTNTAKTYSQALTESREKAKALELGAKLPEVIPPKGDVSKLILPDTGGGGTVNPTPKRNEFRTNYDYMTDKEAAVYKYYRDRGQIEKAQAYLDALEMEVNQRAAVQNKAEAKMLAEESAVAALFARAAMNVGQTAGALYSAAMAGTGRTVDPYHPLMGGVNINEGLYEGLMGESTGVEKFAKEAGLAVFDWGTQAAMLGPATPYVMAAGAAAGNTKDALERGGSTDEAVLYGLTGGAAEAITEKLGYDRLFELGKITKNKGTVSTFLKSLLPQAASEGAEESTSEIANILADTLIMGDNSQMKQIAQTAMENGATESEAVKTALMEGIKQVGYSGAVGAASGGVIAGGVGGISRWKGKNALDITMNPAGMAREAAADAKAEIRGENKKGETGEKQNAEEVQDEIIRDAQAENVGNMPQEQQAEGQTWEPKKAVQDFGEKYYYTEGQKVVNEEAERRGDTSFIPAFQTYYTAGLTGVKESDIKQTAETTVADRGLLSAAYLAGVNDRKADLEARMKGVGKMGQTAGVFLETEAVTPEQRSLAELVSRVAELEVVLVDELPQDRRGYYENNKGRVTIALNSGQFAGTLFHEATHYLREANPEGYDRMQQAVFSAAAARKGMDTDAYIRKYEKRYGEAYRSVGQEVNYNVILEEMTADAFAEIAGDEKSMRTFVTKMQQTNPSVLEKIKEFLDNLLETLKGLVNDGRFSSFGGEIRKDIKTTEKFAKMLAEEMERAGEKQRGEKTEKKGEKKEKKYSFAGEKARTADREKLDMAKKMEEEGKTRREIYDETGWFRGADDKWRFEIDDSQMQYRYAGVPGISAYLQNTELFEAYPELRDVTIKFEKLKNGVKGIYNKEENKITLDESLKEEPGTVLLHEIQHAIQRIEGHASGANREYWERRIEEGFDARTAEEKAKEWNLTKQMEDLKRKNPEFYQDMQELDSMVPTVPRGKIDWETLEEIEPDPIEWQLYDQRREQLEEKYGEEMVWDYTDLKYELDQSRKGSGRTAFDLYYATAGEIETRDTEKRMHFTKEDRKKWFPNIGDEDTVFAEGVRFSIKEDTEGRELSEGQQKFFAESKAVDSRGRLLTLYHQTGNDFTIFEPRRKGAGTSDTETPFGIFLKTTANDIGLKGKKQMELYANIKNPLVATTREDLKWKMQRISDDYEKISQEEQKLNFDYRMKYEAAGKEFQEYVAEWRKKNPNASRQDIYQDEKFQEKFDAEDRIAEEWEEAAANFALRAKEVITKMLENKGYDGIILKEDKGSFGRKTDAYIALHPEQVKRIDNLNPTEDTDIRFSIREEAYDALVEENEALKEANEALRRQFEITKDAVHDPVSAKKAVRKWLKAHDSEYDVDDFTERFVALADYVANAGDRVDFQKVMGALQKLAYDALSESKVLNTDLSDAYKEFKNDVRKTKIKVTEDMAEEFDYYGGYNTVRKENFGKINLSRQGGIYADVFYQEMAEKYPELLDVERVSTQVDVVMDLLDVVDSLQPIYENPYGMNLDEYAMDAAYDLWEMYFDIELQKPTFADKYEKKLEKEKARARAARENLRKDLKERYDEKLQQAKEDQKKKLEDARLAAAMHEGRALVKQRRAIYEKLKARDKERRDRAEYAKYKNIIEKEAALLKRWVERPTDQYHVQESMMEGVRNFLEKMKFDDPDLNIMPTDIHRMMDDYKAMTDENTMLYAEEDENVNELLKSLDKRVGNGIKVSELGPTEMRQLSVVIRSISHLVRNANKMVSIKNGQKISTIGNAYMEDVENKKTKNPDSRLRVLSDMMNVQMLDTESFFKEMGKTVHDTIYRGLREGFDRKIIHVKEASEFMQKTVDKKKIREWGEMEPKEYTLSGGKISLTDAQIMSLYCLMRRTQARGHIFGGGIKGEPVVHKVRGQRKIVKNTEPVEVTAADVTKLMSNLTEEQKKAALEIQGYLESVASWGNEVTMNMLGYKKFTETNYFPIVTDENYINTMYGARGEKNSTLQTMGITKQTNREAKNPIILENIFDAYVRHIDQMSSYNAFVPALSDLNKFMNYREMVRVVDGKKFGENRSVKETMQRVMGPAGDKYVRDLMERLNNPAVKEDVERLPRIFLRNMKIASVGANLRVIIQQPVSYLRAADEIGVGYLMGALVPSKTDFQKVYEYAPIAQWKEWGNYEMNVGRTMKELLIGQNFYESFLEKSMIAAGVMDKLTWGRIWRAAELEVKKKHPELTGNRYYETVGKRFSEIIDGTQVVDSILHRNQMMRSQSLFSQMATSFMSEPTKTYNMMRNSMVAVIKENTPENRKKVVRTFMTLVANGVCVAAAAGLVDMLRDDDDDETLLEKWLQAFRGDFSEAESVSDYILAAIGSNLGNSFNPLGYIPYMRDIFSVIQGYTVQRTDISWLNDLVKSGKNLMRYMSGESNYTLNAVLMDAAGSLSKATGIPINSAKRDIMAIKNTIVNYTLGLDAQYENQKLTYDVGSEKNISMYVKMMLEAKMSGNEQIATRIYNDMVNGGISNEKIDNKIKTEQVKAIKEEPEAMEAAKAYNEGRVDDYTRNVEALAKKGYFMANIESAVESLTKPPTKEDEETFETITKDYWKEEGEVESADYALLFNAYMNGNMADYEKMWSILNAAGKEDNSIRNSMRSRLKSEYWKAKETGDSQRMQRAAEEFYRLGGKRETLEKAPQ